MAATHLGIINQKTVGTITEVGGDDGVTHVVVKTMSRSQAEAPNNHPALNSSITVQDAVVRLNGYSIAYEDGDLATVTYRYGGRNGGNPVDGGENGGAVGIGGGDYYELDMALETVSILVWAFEKYAISRADKRILGIMVQNGPIDSDGAAWRRLLSGDEDAETVADKIEDGIISFQAPVYVWREKKLSASWTINDKLGKINAPNGPAPKLPENGNWLFMGANASGYGNRADEITFTWQSSIYGSEWDEDIYK